jgi:ribosome biogenesis GTPase
MNLKQLGWNDFFDRIFSAYKDQGMIPARIVRETHHIYVVETESGRHTAQVGGLFHYNAIRKSDYPTVGDWVAVSESGGACIIEKVLERKSSFSRQAAGSRKSSGRQADEQVIAANIDILFIVNSLDGGRNFNLRGIERYIAMAQEGGARPVIVLNKADLCEDGEQALREASIAKDIPVHLVSALTGHGLDGLVKSCPPMSTIALSGPSGVGKSALINALLGDERLRTGAQRPHDLRGRHTTTHKELFFLPGGLMLIDTPGMRELGLWGDDGGIDSAFSDISSLAEACKFRDCTHQGEPGCAVQAALAQGALDYARYNNYLEMKSELSFLHSKNDFKARMEKKARQKQLSRMIKKHYKDLK